MTFDLKRARQQVEDSDWSLALDCLEEALDYIEKLEALAKAAKDASAILHEVAKAVHIDWTDDVISSPGYGAETAKELDDALRALHQS